jgi:PAS domain S-box-containing protein
MGVGIWCMHFKGMLAFHLPVPVSYHWPTVLLSLLAAVLASAVALYVVSREKMGRVQLWTGSLIMGAGIAGMHYMGMAAMRLSATCHYKPLLVIASVVIAVLAALAALTLTFDYREDFRGTTPNKVLSAAAMGAAISLMHYTGMASASFLPSSVLPKMAHTVNISSLGNNAIAIVTIIVLGGAMFSSALDRQAQAELRRLNEQLEHRVIERTSQLSAANEELKRLRDEFRLVADTIPALVHTALPDGYIDFLNEQWLEYAGVPMEVLEGWGWTSMIHPDDVDGMVRRWRACIASGEPFEYEARGRRADGEYRWVVHRKVALRDEHGAIIKWYGSGVDIEDIRRAQEALRRSEAYLAEAQKLSHTGSWAWDIVRRVPIYWSAEWYRISGLDPAEGPSVEKARALHTPEEWSRLTEMIGRAVKEKTDYETDTQLVFPDGSTKHIHIRSHVVLNAAGEVVQLVGTVMDITERKRAEEELRRLSSQLLHLHDEERRSIARDLHDTTGQDLVALSAMLSQLHDSLPQTNRKFRNFAAQSLALAERSVRDIRTLSYVLYPPMLDKTGLEDAIQHYLQGFAERTNIDVKLQISPQFGRLSGEIELALFRVVQESLTNIQRHSGSFTAEIRLLRDRGKILLEVLDKGRGIPTDQSQPGSMKEGVGIPSMRERVKRIGGELQVEFRSERGTIVRVKVPIGE